MARIAKALINTQVERAKYNPEGKNELNDGKGLFLQLYPSGAKKWRFRYNRPISKARTKLTIGEHPAITLAQARAKRDEYHALLSQGIDPQEQAKEQELTQRLQQENTFMKWAERWKENKMKKVEPDTLRKNWRRLEMYALDSLGNLPVDKIFPPVVIEALAPLAQIKDRKTGTADSDTLKRVIRLINEVLNYAVNGGAIAFNPCLRIKEIYNFAPAEHHPRIEPEALPKLLSDLSNSNAQPTTRTLFLFQLLTMVRPSEAARAEWAEFDLEAKTWIIPAQKMKMRQAHKIPLSTQILVLLEKLKMQTGHRKYVFTGRNNPNKSMSEQSVNKALVDMGYKGKQDAHGLRSIARTYLGNRRADFEALEMCLAHKVGNSTSLAYDTADFFEERIPIMQQWGDYVEQCAKGTGLFD
ncbi:tyrosine-type recombinase/integrase [Avibacterium gallinarum]|uniref:tyrosine-type recombinase/integrase n=1 Tax=Avibacterium gallinarum TaxID=755 RepID=UPI0039FB9509